MNYPALIQTILSHKWVTAVLILVGALAAGVIIHLILTFILNRRFVRKNTTIQGIELSFEQLKAPLRSLIPAVCIGIALPFTSLSTKWKLKTIFMRGKCTHRSVLSTGLFQ